MSDSSGVLYLTDPACLEHDPSAAMPGHPEVPERLRAIEGLLAEREWLGAERRRAPAASEEQLLLVHPERQLRAVADLAAAGGGAIDVDTQVGPRSYEAALRGVGAACEMTRALLAGEHDAGFCAVRPPGHHAEPERAMGFCLFNNVAIAAELALRALGAERVLVVDWDVHYGNGTAETFRRRADVLVAGIHQAGIFPGGGEHDDTGSGPGEGYTLNLPVPAGSGEELWLDLFDERIGPAGRDFAPDLVLVSAGYDAHRADPLGGCRLEAASFAALAGRVRELAVHCGAPLGMVLEGGYEPLAVAESVAATMAALGGES